MTIQEAITEARRTDKWFRPVGWLKSALTVKYTGLIYTVPTHRGGHHAAMPTAEDICGEWEVVGPQTVNDE